MTYRRIMGALLALVLVGVTACSNGSASSDAPEVKVALSEFAFTPSQTTFTPGQTYRFVVTNTGQVEHELMITPPATGGVSLEQLHEQSLVTVHHLAPGATETVDVTFPADAGTTPLELACHIPGHYESGMKLPITVHS
jgi:uncharacterized cupredoxin-like copper-binding protein